MNTLEVLAISSTVLEFNPLLQTIKSYRTKKTDEISLGTFLVIATIGSIWLAYGVTIHNLPLIIGNIIKLFSAASVVAIVLRYSPNALVIPFKTKKQ